MPKSTPNKRKKLATSEPSARPEFISGCGRGRLFEENLVPEKKYVCRVCKKRFRGTDYEWVTADHVCHACMTGGQGVAGRAIKIVSTETAAGKGRRVLKRGASGRT